MGLIGKVLLIVIKGWITVWGILTNWAYSLVTSPGQKVKEHQKIRSHPAETIKDGDTDVTYIPVSGEKTKLIAEFEAGDIHTMADVWDWSVARYRDKKLLGTRDVLAEEDEVQPNGKMFKKLELGDYRWLTYEEVTY